MKKKILAILMTALMVVSLIPMFSFTALAGEDLTVWKDVECTQAATVDDDYEWDGDKLIIKKDGLTVTGTTTSNYIRVNEDVRNLTIKNLSITSTNNSIYFDGDATLTLIGENVLVATGIGHSGLFFDDFGMIDGSGNLTAIGISDGICSDELVFAQTGTVISSGEDGIYTYGQIEFRNDIGKVVAYGYGGYGNNHAIYCNDGTITLGDNLIIKGSTIEKADEADITSEVDIITEDDYGIFTYIKMHESADVAKSVLIQVKNNYEVKVASDIKNGKVKVDKEKAAKGETVELTVTPNENYKLAELKVTDAKGNKVTVTDNQFKMPESNVTITAEFTKKEITPEESETSNEGETPKTSNSNDAVLWELIALIGLAGIAGIVLKVKKSNK